MRIFYWWFFFRSQSNCRAVFLSFAVVTVTVDAMFTLLPHQHLAMASGDLYACHLNTVPSGLILLVLEDHYG